MNPTNRFQRVMAAVLVCALCGAIALFRERGQAVAEPGTQRAKANSSTKQAGAPEQSPATAIPISDAAMAANAISQLANSVVTIAKVDRGKEGQDRPNTRFQAGVVIDPRGYILTPCFNDDEEKDNDANEGQQFVVRFSNQNHQEYPAEVVENDRLWLLALLKIETTQPLPAISLKNLREPVSSSAVLLVPSVPRKKPVKGRITSTGIRLETSSPYPLIESNFRLPGGEAGSLLVTSRGDPLGITAVGDDESNYAIPLKAVLDFIRSDDALQELLGHLAPNQPPIPPPIPPELVPTSTAPPAQEGRTRAAADVIQSLSPTVVTIRQAENTGKPVPNFQRQAGIVVDPRGYILTLLLDDKDVENDYKMFMVHFSDHPDSDYAADVVANDRSWRLALLKVRAKEHFPAISLDKIQEAEYSAAVFVITSQWRKNPLNGRITSTAVTWNESLPYNFIKSNIKLFTGEAGSLMVSDQGDPIGILSSKAVGGASYAVPLKAVKPFIESAINPDAPTEVQEPFPPPPRARRGPDQTDDELMDSLRVRKPEPGGPQILWPAGADPRISNAPRDSAPATFTLPPAVATGRHFRAVTDSPAEQKLIEQLQSHESAAAELATKIRTLQASGPGERNQAAIADSQRELKSQLSTAFDLKLQLEELQVKELQSRLSRLERQIGQRRALRDKIIARRAAQLVEDNGLQWDTSGTSPQPPKPSMVSERQPPPPAPSSSALKKLRRRAELLVDGMLAGEVKPAAVLSALQELKRIDPPPEADWLELLELMLESTRKLHRAGQISEAELLQIEAACDEAPSANEGAALPPKAGDSPPASQPGGRSDTLLNRPDNPFAGPPVTNVPNPVPALKRVGRFTTKECFDLLACSPDGKLLAIANGDPVCEPLPNGKGKVVEGWKPAAEIRDAQTQKAISLNLTTRAEDAVLAAMGRVPDFTVTALAVSPDGNLVAVGTDVGQVKLFHSRTGKLVRSLDDEPARRADQKTPDGLKSLARALGSARSLAFSPDGSLLAVCGGSFADDPLVSDGTSRSGLRATGPGRLKVWEVKSGTLKHDLVAFGDANAVAFSPDGTVLGSAGSWLNGSEAGTGVILWNAQTGEKIRTITNNDNQGTWSVAFSPDSQQVAIGSLNQDQDQEFLIAAVRLANVATGITEWRQRVPYSSGKVSFAPDGKSIAVMSGQWARSIKLLDVETGILEQEIRSTVNKPTAPTWFDFAIAPQGGKLLISGNGEGRFGFVEVWDFDDPGSTAKSPVTTGSTAPATGKPVSVSRVFPLRFKLASEMVDDLRQILLGREGHEAKPSVDNQEVLVTAPPDVMARVQTFICVMDWPDEITRGLNFEYSRESVIWAARSFFCACAIEDDPEVFSKLLSLYVLAELKGEAKSENFQKYLLGGTADPEWETTLRGDWPGKKEAIRRFVGEWNKYPLKRMTETDGVAIGFGVKHFCSVSFAGAPKEFYEVMITPDRTWREGDKTLYLFSSLPPWWKSENRTDSPKTDDDSDVGHPIETKR